MSHLIYAAHLDDIYQKIKKKPVKEVQLILMKGKILSFFSLEKFTGTKTDF